MKQTENITIENINETSSRTKAKILSRMHEQKLICCSRCGWDEGKGDLHHINGRKIKNADNHLNLCYLCPNCHRLVHEGKVKKETLVNLNDFIGDAWREYYFAYAPVKRVFKTKEEKEKTKQLILEKKKQNQEKINDRIKLIKNSNIDFKKYGWMTNVSKLCKISPQKISIWMKHHMPGFYKDCFTRN